MNAKQILNALGRIYDKAMGILGPLAILAAIFFLWPILNNEGAGTGRIDCEVSQPNCGY